jgi:subtilisin family serine protease
MSKNKQVRKVLSLIISLIMVMGYFTSFVYAENNQLSSAKEDLRKEASMKIEPEVMKGLNNEDLAEVLVYMADQVDAERVAYATESALSSAMTPYQTKLQVRKGVIEALKDNAELTQVNILNYLEKELENGNVVEFTPYHIVNMVYVKATKEVIENLSYMSEVEKIYENKIHTLGEVKLDSEIKPSDNSLEWNIERVKANEVWALGYDGTGIVVANIDSGVDWTHPALKNKWRGYDPTTGAASASGNWFDPVYNAALPADSDEHGTHVMGTMVGQEPDGSNKIGVAPGAKWIAARVFNTAGSTTDAILLSAAQWILEPGGNPDNAPDVVNNSWGGGAGIDDWYREAVRAWRAAGIFPVFSAGNQRAGEPLPWPGSISCPANYPESFAVAATDRNDIRASFSKLGPSPYDESLIKPNISAPGASIRSSVPGGGYQGGWSGTSMSAPAISGTVALLLSANASLSIEDMEDIIQNTARPLTDSTYPAAPNMGYGYGMVDAFEAVSSIATGTGYISGRVLVPGEDASEATITHEQEIFETYMGSDIEILAEISDDVAITEAELLVKQQGKSYWMVAPMNRISGDHKNGMYKGTITHDMLMGDSIVYKIKVRDYAGDVVVTSDYKIDIEFGVIPGEYTQGFENNANGWIFDGAWEWGVPSNVGPKPFEGEKLAATTLDGNYPNNADSWMITPPIDLRDANLETASLRFYEWYNMQNSYDKGYVLITNDYGETWTESRPVITGIREEWKEALVNLDSYIGSKDPVFVAFRFTSNASTQAVGWYIDNVRLMAQDNDAPAIPANLTAEVGLTGIKLSWNHSPDADLSHYNIYRSETSGEGYVKIGETTSNNYQDTEGTVGTTYYYVLNAVDFSGNISGYAQEVSAVPVEAQILFGTDFENDNGGFVTGVTAGTANPWEWGVPTSGPNAAYSGEKLWATNLAGNYDHRTDAYIETPSIVIPEDKDGILIFNHWVDMEGTTTLWDYGQVQISKDNGATWTNITPAAGGKYGRRVQEWANEEIVLTGYSGETIKLRFFFHSDTSGVYTGWYIDDIYVMGIDHVEPEPIEGEELIYDDGTAEDALVLNAAGNGLAVRFTPSQFGKVQAANIYLWGNDWPTPGGNRLGFVIYDSNGNQVGTPMYLNNLVRGGWNLIDLSGFNFSTGSDFYISTMQDAIGDNSPGTGLDDNSTSDWTKSYLNIGGQLSPLADAGADYEVAVMIRAIMDYDNAEPTVDNPLIRPVARKKSMGNVDAGMMRLGELEVEKDEIDKVDYVEPTAPEYSLKAEEMLRANNFETIEDIEVQNMPMVFAGIPISDAVVTVLETGRSVKVDPVTGKFFMRSPIGEYTLVAEAYGYYSKEARVNVVEDQTAKSNFILEPKPQGTITGRVFDRYYETPAAYAVVRVVEDPKVAPVTADAEGYFVIPNVLEGTYTLKVVADGFEPGETTADVVGNETVDVNIGLKRFVGYEDNIIYDDGTAENALVLNAAPNGLAVRFTPDQFGKVKGTNIYFWDTSWPSPGGNRIGFTIFGIDANGKPYKVGEPIFQDVVRGAWNYIDLSSFGFSTDKDFYISTIQDKVGTQCPGTGIDQNSPYADRSYMNVDGEFKLISSEDIEGGLMIRARMEYAMDVPAITNLAPESYTNQDTIRVEGKVTADGKVNVYVNDVKATSIDSENRVFAVEVPIPEERNTIKVTAELNGIETEPSASVVVIKDKLAPVLTVEKPLDNAKIKEESVHVIGTVTDNIGLAKLEINDKEILVDESNSFHERLMLDQGENTITVKATDGAGNVTTVVRTVLVELESPTITNIQPSEDIELGAGDVLRVSFNAPTGGQGYFRIMVPFGLQSNEIGIPMTEEDGLYTGTWTVPEETGAENLLIEVVYRNEYGYEITQMAEGKVKIIAGEGPVDPEPGRITNLQPTENTELRSDETLEISFNAPAGGKAYYRIMLPFGPSANRLGNEMTEVEPGLYKATYRAHEGVVASNLQIEVIFTGEDGATLTEVAKGKITLVGDIEDLPVSAVIIGDEAFDTDYLNNNPRAQAKLVEWYNSNNPVYIKLNNNTFITEDGEKVSVDVLPELLQYFDTTGIKLYAK